MSEHMTIFITIVISVSLILAGFAYAILTVNTVQNPISTGPPPYATRAMKIVSISAFQNPSNSSQASALGIVVEIVQISFVNFTCGGVYISLATPTASYNNVYTTSDFVNASTFANTYGSNFTSYQSIAPNCSIIELNGNGNQILEQNETFAVFLNLNSSNLNCLLPANAQFTVQITASGAQLTCTYRIPSIISPVMNLILRRLNFFK
jgi:hypothetical protein